MEDKPTYIMGENVDKELDYLFDYRQATMTVDEYFAALFLDSLEAEIGA